MKSLADFDNQIHSCSKCGLCQSVCPIYKITGNDCTVSRGQFIMLRGVIKNKLKMSKTINRYLDLCLKCGACTKFCPSGIDVVDIVASAKAEYFKMSKLEKLISRFQKVFVFGLGVRVLKFLKQKHKSKNFDKKVVYFGGCKGEDASVIKLLNALNIEVITPDFDCCGIPFYVRGDFETFKDYMNKFFEKLQATGIREIVTTCASCEKTLKSYKKWSVNSDYEVKNVYEYIREKELKLTLKKAQKVTFHKPCNLSNFDDIRWILENTKNLEYVEMQDYEKCCGLNGITKIGEYKIFSELFKEKRANIIDSGAKVVLTACAGCEASLKLFSLGKYKVYDLTDFLTKGLKNE